MRVAAYIGALSAFVRSAKAVQMAQPVMWQLVWPLSSEAPPLHALLDGSRDTETLLRDASQLQPPVSPLDVLAQLRTLQDDALVRQVSAKIARAKLNSPPVLALGLLALVAVAAFLNAVDAWVQMCAYNHPLSPRDSLLFGLSIAALLLVCRSGARQLSRRVVGLLSRPPSSAGLADRHPPPSPQSTTTPRQKLWTSAAGLLGPLLSITVCLVAVATMPMTHVFWVGDYAAGPLCADAVTLTGWIPAFLLPYLFTLFWLDLAPYLPTAGATLLSLATGIPDLRRRSLAFLSRRVVRNLRSRQPLSELERSYLRVASLWLFHAVGSIGLLAFWGLPAALQFASHSAQRAWPKWQWALGTLPALICLSLLLLLIWRLIAIAAAFLRQSVVSQHADTPRQSVTLAVHEAAEFVQSAAGIPFLAALGQAALIEIAAQAKSESHVQGSILIKQGQAGDRFCFLAKGTARVVVEEESGLQHEVAILQAGAFFGETALVEPVTRTATVVAESSVELVTLDRERFLAVVAAAGASGAQVRAQIRNAACLSSHPLFQGLGRDALRRLQESATETVISDGTAVVTQRETGETLYVVRDGSFVVSRSANGKSREIAVLGHGDWFGELALLGNRPRSATVRARGQGAVLALPRAAVDAALAADLHAAAYLHEVCAERLAMLALGGAA